MGGVVKWVHDSLHLPHHSTHSTIYVSTTFVFSPARLPSAVRPSK